MSAPLDTTRMLLAVAAHCSKSDPFDGFSEEDKEYMLFSKITENGIWITCTKYQV